MKRMRVGLAALLFTAGLVSNGCERKGIYNETGESPVLHEGARVAQTIYVPESNGHGSSTGYQFGEGGGVIISSTSVHVPAKYAVVFECQHGKFIIEGEDEKYKNLWKKLKDNQTVDVEYKEIYDIKCEYKGDNDRTVLERKLVKYDFLDANPIERE